MKKLLSAFLLGSSFFAPISVIAHEGGNYTGCKVGESFYGCHLHQTNSTPTSREYELHTIGNEIDIVVNCTDVKYSNQKTSGTLLDLKSNKTYPISCVFAVSTRSHRSIVVYNRGASEPIFHLDTRHNVGR
jgi:hypothetical protein